MNKKELLHIISKGECEQTEFKENFGKQVIETIVAFANTKGGNIFIGIKDNKQVSGIMLNSETLQNWHNQIKLSTQPSMFTDIELFEIENKTIAHIQVNEFPVKPISVKGKYFKRIKNSNHQMNLTEISDEHLKTINSSWDFYIDPNNTLKSI
ncbi:MAG: ATP-binding protein [Bacteroidota bacterium]